MNTVYSQKILKNESTNDIKDDEEKFLIYLHKSLSSLHNSKISLKY